jgi:hypothetical protein
MSLARLYGLYRMLGYNDCDAWEYAKVLKRRLRYGDDPVMKAEFGVQCSTAP